MPDPARETLARMELRFLGATGAWGLLAFAQLSVEIRYRSVRTMIAVCLG